MPLYHIPNLANACRVLKLLGQESEPLPVTRLSRMLGIPRTTCLRITETLAGAGFLVSKEGGCSLGMELVPIGQRALDTLDVHALSGPVLEKLTRDTGETGHLAVWSDGRALILRVCDSAQALRATSRAGTAADAHCSATGKVLLAWNHLDRLDEAIPPATRKARTQHTLIETDGLRRNLLRARERGYAVDNEEYHAGVRCAAAPVRDATDAVVAALGITGVSSRLPGRRMATAAAQVCQAASDLSRKMGWNS